MVVKQIGRRFELEPPASPGLTLALNAIMSTPSRDSLVTNALRKFGTSNDFWSILYASDLDADELAESQLKEGQVEIVETHNTATGPAIISEVEYLTVLAAACEFDDFPERASLLRAFIKDPRIAADLDEANPERCEQKWLQFVPFLKAGGWGLTGEMIAGPTGGLKYNVVSYSLPLEVIYRNTCRTLKNFPPGLERHKQDYESLKMAL